jgi:hypothetical protein
VEKADGKMKKKMRTLCHLAETFLEGEIFVT